MKYLEAVTDFFKSPKWVMNLLFAGICILVPFIGPVILIGWLITGFWTRTDERFETFPDFDLNQLSKYLGRGLWPVLVQITAAFVVGVGLMIVVMIPMMILTAVLHSDGGGFFATIMGLILSLISLVLYVAVIAGLTMVMIPLSVRSTLTQDFMQSFDIPWLKQFILMMWKDMLIVALALVGIYIVLSIAGFAALCIGIFFAIALFYFAWHHLAWQTYKLYLSRGGQPVPVSQKLAAGTL
ncbi:MAG: DUF4013 domain-containing protein [Verrucomicrobium sp.]|nr:DUF4013 domain-containing protein [Verrucomicrobium sp.]